MAKKQKKKKELEPQYFTSATNIKTLNYGVYYMSLLEKVLYFSMAFLIGAGVGYLFYGGIGANEFGEPTKLTYILNTIICTITGLVAGKLFLPARNIQILKKRKNQLKMQFRALLDTLSTSIGSGKTVSDAFREAQNDMKIIYSEDAYIVKELEVINSGVNNNLNVEIMLLDFGKRSHLPDIESFANVFETCYRKGGDIKDVIRSTQQILNEKLEIELEIETLVTSNKTEQSIMTFMPVILVGIIKGMSPEFGSNFASGAGIISTTIAVAMFIAAYFIGKEVLDIKI
ncbi:type II secretion system protein F (GspF) [Mobilisporobacter senegalensis]|uniref:Type II secretion system protein F (GspF) n=1 Tax=Mobilisporobacter senegalensis TaxID=1329262 RepID=A0A3N1XPV8_9FIRM|nr:type II secretion system F family protein [Mobilisporobacter senegalensis]ROR28703.1 type II secretion system protein F (GspF) [Mobilisporobacter senegalensis]